MSTSKHDDLYIVDCQSYDSRSDVSFPFPTSSRASAASFDYDLQSPFDPLSDNDDSVLKFPTLDSFLPILKHLPGLYLDQNSYYIRGSIAAADWARLRDYARTVSKFTVTYKDSESRISPAAFLRLALSQDPELPFFPSLSDLVIDADESLSSYLELLLTPSLESLEVLSIPVAQQPILLSFLTTLAQKVPPLQTLKFGPGRVPSSSFYIIPQFNNLRHLELKNKDLEIPSGFPDNIGSLSKLETLILDARDVSSIASKTQPNGMDQPTVPPTFENVNALPPDSCPGSSSMDGDRNEDGAGNSDVLLSQACHTFTSLSTSGAFSQLRKLHVIGRLPLLEDLISRITSTTLEDVSVTLICLSDDEKRRKRMKSKSKAKDWDTKFLRMLCCRWTESLKTVSLYQLNLLKPTTLPQDIFLELLRLPALEILEVKGWGLDSVETLFGVGLPVIPNLESLLLPLDEINSGISLSALRDVAGTCPKLKSFQCRIDSRSVIPEYTVPTTKILSHGLRTLSVGNSSPYPDSKNLYLIARHLDLLFPHLEKITVSEEHNAKQWAVVDELVRMCQTARMDERYRASLNTGLSSPPLV